MDEKNTKHGLGSHFEYVNTSVDDWTCEFVIISKKPQTEIKIYTLTSLQINHIMCTYTVDTKN